MTNVIAFPQPARSGQVRRRPAAAQILFFTGVRYVRDEVEDHGPAGLLCPPVPAGTGLGAGERLHA